MPVDSVSLNSQQGKFNSVNYYRNEEGKSISQLNDKNRFWRGTNIFYKLLNLDKYPLWFVTWDGIQPCLA